MKDAMKNHVKRSADIKLDISVEKPKHEENMKCAW
jgi:hypothetical protein